MHSSFSQPGKAMTRIHHINCGYLQKPPNPKAICHCLLLEDSSGLALVDTGIGLLDARHPLERIGQTLIDMAGFQFHPADTAVRQVEKLGFAITDVKHAIITHLDPDHIGGLVDFPNLQVHVSAEEYANFKSGNGRYLPIQLAHQPKITTYSTAEERWFGLEARKVDIGFSSAIYLVPLFGHTLGHCGVAIQQPDKWVFHIGDAYYLRVETSTDDHPVSQLTSLRADDNTLRIESLNQVKRLLHMHKNEIEIFGYHDESEFTQLSKS